MDSDKNHSRMATDSKETTSKESPKEKDDTNGQMAVITRANSRAATETGKAY